MESFDDKIPNKEPTHEELNQLLESSYDWICKIIEEHNSEENVHSATVSATTPEADENYKIGSVSVEDLDGVVLKVSINETDYLKSENTTTERFKLTYLFGVGGYELQATGVQPNVLDDVIDSDGTEQDFQSAYDATEEYLNEILRPATPAEIQRLAYVLEIGAHGDVPFDFDRFEIEYQHHLDKLYMDQYEAENKAENENHPE